MDNKLIITVTAVILFVAFLLLHSKHKSPFKAAVITMVTGTGTLIAAGIFLSVAVNVYTVFLSLTLGVFGTALVVLLV